MNDKLEEMTQMFKSPPICSKCGTEVKVYKDNNTLFSICEKCKTYQHTDVYDENEIQDNLYQTFGANFLFGRSSAPLNLNGKKLKVFISGPMTGYKDYNFKAFSKIEEMLTKHGIESVNPATICKEFTQEEVISDKRVYAKMVKKQQEAEKTCTAILLLDGWESSNGARLELNAALRYGLDIYQEKDIPFLLMKARNPKMKTAITLTKISDEDWKTQLARKYPDVPAGERVAILKEDYYNFYGGPYIQIEWNGNSYYTYPENVYINSNT